MVEPTPNNRRETHDGTKNSVSFQSTYSPIRSVEGDTGVPQYSNPRCILWVDAVGGYLVCLGDEIVLGQAIPGTTVDVPILADLSRRPRFEEKAVIISLIRYKPCVSMAKRYSSQLY